MKIFINIILFCMVLSAATAQQKSNADWWQGQLHRADGHIIIFNFEWKQENGKSVWYIRNAAEK